MGPSSWATTHTSGRDSWEPGAPNFKCVLHSFLSLGPNVDDADPTFVLWSCQLSFTNDARSLVVGGTNQRASAALRTYTARDISPNSFARLPSGGACWRSYLHSVCAERVI